jgi:hypothetical protein
MRISKDQVCLSPRVRSHTDLFNRGIVFFVVNNIFSDLLTIAVISLLNQRRNT